MVFHLRNTRHPVYQLRDEMDRLLTGFLGEPINGGPWAGSRGRPAVNLWENESNVIAELEIPGVKSEQVDISVVAGELSLKVQRPDVPQEGVTYHRRERAVGSFSRVLRLPTEVDAEQVEAELRDGVLTITLPKAESAKPRRIEVASA